MTRVLLAAFFSAFTCTLLPAADKPPRLPAAVVGHWVHSHEEDAEGVKVYRFPPARGRAGFEIKKCGEFGKVIRQAPSLTALAIASASAVTGPRSSESTPQP